jgi:hypothetical protein
LPASASSAPPRCPPRRSLRPPRLRGESTRPASASSAPPR